MNLFCRGNAPVAREQLPPICFLYKTHIFHSHAVRVLITNGLLTKADQLPLVSFIEPCWLFGVSNALPVTLHPPRIRRRQEESEGRFIGGSSQSPTQRLYALFTIASQRRHYKRIFIKISLDLIMAFQLLKTDGAIPNQPINFVPMSCVGFMQTRS